jgi:hypothetical protein
MAHAHVTNAGLERATALVMADLNHSAVGTSTTSPLVSDTQLGTETNRIATTTETQSGRAFQNRTFYANADMPATIEEVGWFMNGSASANSGSILAHVLLNFVKASDDMTLVLIMKLNPVAVAS